MALRPLTDPAPLVLADGTSSPQMGNVFWYPGVGLIGNLSYDYHWCKISLDGIVQRLSSSFVEASPIWDDITGTYWVYRNDGLYHLKDSYVFGRSSTTRSIIVPFNINVQVVAENLCMSQNGTIFNTYDLNTAKYTNDYTFPFNAGASYVCHPGRRLGELFVGSNLQGCFYDYRHKKVTSPLYYVPQGDSLSYAKEFDIFISIYNQTIQVYSTEVEPTTLSSPKIIAGIEKSGRVVTYQVRATGSYGEPAPKETISWELAGNGELSTMQSLTDENGYATADVVYGIGVTGNATITATLVS